MAVQRMLAQMTVLDLTDAIAWYSRLLDRAPDSLPMDGVAEWHLTESVGVQLWADAERAGGSAMVLDESDLDGLVERLSRIGIAVGEPQDATSSRILPLEDPDGNRIVFTGAFRSA